MGGCSSKPKTAEFEGGMCLQAVTTQGESKSLEAEKIIVDAGLKAVNGENGSSERSVQTLVTEREQDDLRDMFTEVEKQTIADVSPEGSFKEERQVDHQHVKKIMAETISDSGVVKGLPLEGEILKLQMIPEVIASELHEEPVFILEVTKKLQEETPLLANIESETADMEQEPLSLLKETLDNEVNEFVLVSKSLSLKDKCSSTHVADVSKLQVKLMGPQDGDPELSKNLSVGGEAILELQREPYLLEDVDLASSCGRMGLDYHKAVSKIEEGRLDDSAGHEGQDKQVLEGSKTCKELCDETDAGACEVINDASGCVLALERGEKVLNDLRKPVREDEIKGVAFEKAAGEFITSTCTINSSPFAEATDKEPSREIDGADVVHPVTTDIRKNNLQRMGHEQDIVQGEQEIDVDAAYKVAMKDVILQDDIHQVNGFCVKDILDTTDGEGELVSANISMDDKHLLPLMLVLEQSSGVQLLPENSLGKVQEEKSSAAVICIKGQWKLDASCTPEEVTASQVIATTKKPEAQSGHAMDFAELAFVPAQDIPAPDIDEVLEKLASEFERQESLARAT